MPFGSLSAAATVFCFILMAEHALLTAESTVLWGIDKRLCDKSYGRE